MLLTSWAVGACKLQVLCSALRHLSFTQALVTAFVALLSNLAAVDPADQVFTTL